MSRVVESQEVTFAFFHLGKRGLVSPKEQPSGGHSSAGLEGEPPFVSGLHWTFCPGDTKTSLGPTVSGALALRFFPPFSFDHRSVLSSSLWVLWLLCDRQQALGRQLPGLGREVAAWRGEVKQKAHPWPWHEAPANWCVRSRLPSSRDWYSRCGQNSASLCTWGKAAIHWTFPLGALASGVNEPPGRLYQFLLHRWVPTLF